MWYVQKAIPSKSLVKETQTILQRKRRLKTEEYPNCLNITEKCVPSLVTSLEKISSTSAETASTRGLKIHLCPVAGNKSQIRTRARRKSSIMFSVRL